MTDLMVFIPEMNYTANIKNGAYVINLDDLGAPGTHWIVLYCKNNNVAYFDSFAAGHVPEEVK